MTTRGDMVDNKYYADEPLIQNVAKAIEIGVTPYTLKFFELINSPQGPWLQMLQRVYYSDEPIDADHRRHPRPDDGDRGGMSGAAGSDTDPTPVTCARGVGI